MEKESLSYASLKNASYGTLNFIIPILLSIIVTPIVVRGLGPVDYGIFILTNTIIGLMGLIDLGLTAAVTKYISQYHSMKDWGALKKITDSANSLYLIIGLVGFLIFFALGKFFLGSFQITGATQAHIRTVFLFGGAIFFVNAINSVYTTVPLAVQRFDISAKINLAQIVVLSLSTLGLVLFGFQLKAIMAANLAIVLCTTMFYRVYSKKLVSEAALGFAWSKAEIKKMYSFGFFAAISSIGLGSLNQIDRLIIPVFLGPVQLSYYSLPGNVAQKIPMVISNLAGSWIFPLASGLAARGEIGRLGGIHRKIMRNIIILAAAISAAIYLFGYKILEYWLGKEYAEKGHKVLLILTVTNFVLNFFGPTIQHLLGMGKERILAVWMSAFAVLNLILLIPLVKYYGITGAAWAYLISTLPIFAMLYWMEKKVFNMNGIFSFYAKLYAKLLLTFAVFYILIHYVIIGMVNNLITLVFAGPLAVLSFLALYKLFGFVEDEDWQLFMSFAKNVKAKFLGNKYENFGN